jgi:hypothetical protein
MICIFLAALGEAWQMILHPNKVNKFHQDPPTNFKTVATQLVKGLKLTNYSSADVQFIITLQMLSLPFILATTLAGDKS